MNSRRVLTVSPTEPGCHRRISDALAVAESGTIINVLPGEYAETLRLAVPVTITARDGRGSVLIVPVEGHGVLMQTETATLAGLVIRHRDDKLATVDIGSGRLRLDNCALTAEAPTAVFVRNGASVVLADCAITNSVGAGVIAVEEASGSVERCSIGPVGTSGVVLRGGADLAVRDCVITGAQGNGVCSTDGAKGVVQRCEISRTGGPAVVLEKLATTRLSGVRIHDTSDVGVYLAGGRTTIDGCEITETAGDGILVAEGADPVVSAARVSRTRGHAIRFIGRSRGTFDQCEVRDTPVTGIWVGGGSDPTFTGLRLRDCADASLLVSDGATGTFDDVEIHHSRQHGVRVASGANPLLRKLTITGCHGHGIVVAENGRGRVHGATITDTRFASVRSLDGGSPELVEVSLGGSGDVGVLVGGQGRCALRDCEIFEARAGGAAIEDGGELTLVGSTVRDCGGDGVRFAQGARGELRSCEIRGNEADGVCVDSDQPIVIRDCVVTGNGGAGLSQAVPGPRLSVENLRSEENESDDEYGPGARATSRGTGATGHAKPKRVTGELESTEALLAQLQLLVGLASAKREVSTLVNLQQLARKRAAVGLPSPPMSRHLIFAGPPGTGKTSVARLYARILASLGTLPVGHVVEVARQDLVAQYVGATAIKTTEKFTEALGGVLFIDEAYTLSADSGGSGADFGREAIDTLVKLMEDHRDEVIVIAAGYSHEMRQFLQSNPGLASRFTRTVEFDSYTPEELVTIVEGFCKTHQYTLEYGTRAAIERYFARMQRDETFGNARSARKVFEEMVDRQAQRLSQDSATSPGELSKLLPEDLGSVAGPGIGTTAGTTSADLPALIEQLNSMVGLASVKREVTDLINLIGTAERRRRAGLPVPNLSRHLIFSGAPGTGKTTVARLFGQVLAALGVLANGQLIEVSRGDLVAEYIGQTARRTKDAFDRARGGVLFIDEAYALTRGGGGGGDFGTEAVDTLVKLMEDHRDEVVVIAAGYVTEMRHFLAANPGLASRFSRPLEFENYTPDELVVIFNQHAETAGYVCTPATLAALTRHFGAIERGADFGNGRYARQVLDRMVTRQAGRTMALPNPSTQDLAELLPEDLQP
ncbi:SpoVK/Ycf46/Vps4 family AAA+-type ATPase [Allocatelliglobosispora scoriae]|uniref:SpoVK/Ycf46/Vps4 family AAA+-type ATPase n=1 Tax=Allocatelliglobosispora scoriae TaxID=643052 RepID=A0A841C5X2_9ACTN|nr:right-handed parallel beta-helix repeat-containing protein [Allocatelliglobosispora scoriae]MBB5874201.1 SpoVK/Ycf46/Vps4 family AAA+-type ATPase [Allocatelliglobosispora scoriae]